MPLLHLHLLHLLLRRDVSRRGTICESSRGGLAGAHPVVYLDSLYSDD